MHFPKITTALAFMPVALGQLSVYPPGGPGTILVTINGQSSPSGCLNADAKWVAGTSACATVSGNGQGGVGSSNGYFVLNANSDLGVVTTTWTTAWVGTHVNQARNAYFLQANIGSTGSAAWGGPLFFANSAPTGSGAVVLNGHAVADSQQVILTFNSTFVG